MVAGFRIVCRFESKELCVMMVKKKKFLLLKVISHGIAIFSSSVLFLENIFGVNNRISVLYI